MAFIRYILPALAVSSTVLAANDPCSGTINIQSQGDADALGSCTIVKGDVVIAKTVQNDLTFNGVEQITGNFKADGAANVTSINAPTLASIGDEFLLNGVLQLTSLSMPKLTAVGTISWEALPLLQSLSFGTPGVTNATDVLITNTGLDSLSGVSLKQVRNFQLVANSALATVDVTDIKNVTGLLTFSANAESLTLQFDELVGAQNMTIHNATQVTFPALEAVKGQLGLFGNAFKSFTAPNLTETGDLVFDDNSQLSNISLPQLTTINGGFQIARNNELKAIEGVPKLQKIVGALDWTGNFNNVSLPALKEIQGGFNMQSTGSVDCSQFQSLKGSVIKGSYDCSAKTSNPTTLGGAPGANGSGTSSGGTSTSSSAAMADLGQVPVAGLTAVVGALLGLLM